MSDDIISKALGLPSMPDMRDDVNSEIEDAEIVEETIAEDVTENETTQSNELVDYEETHAEIIDNDTNDVAIFESEIDKEYIDDVTKAKKNVSKMIVDGHWAFEKLLLVATQTENPTAFDSASRLLKTLVDANKEMANLSNMKRDAKTMKNRDANGITNNTTNNTVILTTAEILKTLKK